jgi:malate permease and related proteins
MSAFLTAAGVVMPVVLLLIVGRVLERTVGLTDAQSQGLGKLAYWVCLPALLFRDVCRAHTTDVVHFRLLAALALVVLLTALLGYRYAHWARLPPGRVGVVAQGAFRSNMLFVGLPIVLYYATSRAAPGTSTAALQAMMANATLLVALALSVSVPLTNVVSVLLLVLPHRAADARNAAPARLLRNVLTNPLVLSALLGYLARLIPGQDAWMAPTTVIGRTLDLAGQGALPAALIAIGASLDPRRVLADWRHTVPVALMKLVLMPALTLAALLAAGVRGLPLAAGVLLLACPTAASSQPLVLETGGDDVLAGDIVALTTFLCPLTLVGWLTVLYAIG